MLFFLRIRRPPSSTRTDTLFPYTTHFRAILQGFLHDGLAVLPSGHVRSWQKGDCWMERRTLIGGLLLSSGIIGVRWPVAARGRRDSEANEEAMRSAEHTSELQ